MAAEFFPLGFLFGLGNCFPIFTFLKLKGMINRRLSVSALILFFFLGDFFPSIAKVYFHSDFELGETYTQQEVKPGAKKIRLVPNHRLSEWPQTGGTGVIEGNLPAMQESFSYQSRKKDVLLGVSGITKRHEKNVDVRTTGFNEWESGAMNSHRGISFTKQNALFGNFSAQIDCHIDSAVDVSQSMPEGLENFAIRFSMLFSKDFFNYDSVNPPVLIFEARYKDYLFPHIQIQGTKGDSVFLALHSVMDDFQTVVRQEDFPRIFLAPGRKYCVEYGYKNNGPKEGHFTLLVNGRTQMVRQLRFITESLHHPNSFSIRKDKKHTGMFFVDEIALADTFPGMIPEKPAITFTRDTLFGPAFLDPAEGIPPAAAVWQINSVNSWVLPLFNSGEEKNHPKKMSALVHTVTLIPNDATTFTEKIPVGLKPGEPYFARVRYKNSSGNWSDWSTPVSFLGPSDIPPSVAALKGGAPEIVKIVLCDSGGTRPVKTLRRLKWYDLYVYLKDKKGWSNLGLLDVWISMDPENSLGNYQNRGGIFDPAESYIFNYTFYIDPNLFVRQKPMTDQWAGVTGIQGLYTGRMLPDEYQNKKEGFVKIRFRLLKEAKAGPLVIHATGGNQDSRVSPIFRQLYFLREDQDSMDSRWMQALIAGGIFGFAGVAFLIVFFRRRRHARLRLENGSDQPAEGPGIVPLDFNSPYDENIKKARDFILSNYHKPISPSDVAQAINVSPSWLSDFFKKGTGKTAIQYIHEVKIEHAKKLLQETKIGISEIAFQVGFDSDLHFRRVFHKIEKISPKEFRKKYQ